MNKIPYQVYLLDSCKKGTSGPFCEQISDPCGRKPCLAKADLGGSKVDSPCTVLEQDEISISKPATLSGYVVLSTLIFAHRNFFAFLANHYTNVSQEISSEDTILVLQLPHEQYLTVVWFDTLMISTGN